MAPVLIVDADEFERLGLRMALTAYGYDIHEASDQGSALELAHRIRPVAAVVDISIPADGSALAWSRTKNGISLTRHLKSILPDLGVVLFSAYEQHLDDFLDLLSGGARGLAYCLKGRRVEALATTLERVLAGRVEIDPEVHTRAHTIANELRDRLTPAERPWIERAVRSWPRLTAQEARAAASLAASCSPDGVARRLGIQRADNLICRVYAKLGLAEVPAESPDLRQVSLVIKAHQIHMLEDHVL